LERLAQDLTADAANDDICTVTIGQPRLSEQGMRPADGIGFGISVSLRS
jgi:hypothetical protein